MQLVYQEHDTSGLTDFDEFGVGGRRYRELLFNLLNRAACLRAF